MFKTKFTTQQTASQKSLQKTKTTEPCPMENPHDLTKVQKSFRQKLPLRAVPRTGGVRVTQTAGGKVQSPAGNS